MTEQVPDGWESERLEGHLDILSGFPFKSAQFTNDPAKIGLIRIRDLVEQDLETFFDGYYSDDYIIRKGDVLVGMDGDFNVVKWKVRDALLNQRICKVTAKQNSEFVTDFIFHTLTPELQQIHNATGATTVKHLSVKDIRNIEKPFPPKSEQHKIASILTSVDEVIEKTETQISKLQDLKKGMMQELLTKGIGHTEYKDSPIGRIPKEWDYLALNDLVQFSQGVQVDLELQSDTPKEGFLPFLRIENFTQDSKDIRYIHKDLARGKLIYPDDVVLVRYGASAGYVGRRKEGVLANNLFVVSPDEKRLTKDLLYLHLLAAYDTFQVMMAGGAMPALNFSMVGKLHIPLPPVSEQVIIYKSINSIETRIESGRTKLHSFKSIKKALMQDLLTGKVRVKTD